MRHLILIVAFCAVCSVSNLTSAQEPAPRYSIKQDNADTGSNIRRDVVSGSVIPLNKRYSELTLEQQAQVRSQYESLGPNDEPPFPLDGLGPIYKSIAAAQQRLLVVGRLSVAVDISSQGEATSVSVFDSPDPQMVKIVASLLMAQMYKPALCDGTPCQMKYPFRITFQTRTP